VGTGFPHKIVSVLDGDPFGPYGPRLGRPRVRTSREVPVGYIEDVKRRGADGEWYYTGKVKAVPWDAERGKRGPSKVFERESQADAYIKRMEGVIDTDYAAEGIQVHRQSRVVTFPDYAMSVAKAVPGELASRNRAKTHARQLAAHWPKARIEEIDRPAVRAYMELRMGGPREGASDPRGTLGVHWGVLRQVTGATPCRTCATLVCAE
jgi:hypothetical protein